MINSLKELWEAIEDCDYPLDELDGGPDLGDFYVFRIYINARFTEIKRIVYRIDGIVPAQNACFRLSLVDFDGNTFVGTWHDDAKVYRRIRRGDAG